MRDSGVEGLEWCWSWVNKPWDAVGAMVRPSLTEWQQSLTEPNSVPTSLSFLHLGCPSSQLILSLSSIQQFPAIIFLDSTRHL